MNKKPAALPFTFRCDYRPSLIIIVVVVVIIIHPSSLPSVGDIIVINILIVIVHGNPRITALLARRG
jgi:hypothetical protein